MSESLYLELPKRHLIMVDSHRISDRCINYSVETAFKYMWLSHYI